MFDETDAPTGLTMYGWLRHRLVPTLRDTFRAWSEDDGPLLSAAMAYYAAFSLFPLILVLISVLGLVMRFSDKVQNSQQKLLEVVGENTSPWLADQLEAMLAGVETSASLNAPVGLLVLIAAAIGIFMQLEAIFDRIWREEKPKQRGMVAAVKRALFDRLADLKRALRASLCYFQTARGRLRRLIAKCYTRPANQTGSAGS